MKESFIDFYGIKFCNSDFKLIVSRIEKGGYLVAPAASSLSKIFKNREYHNSLINSKVAILDSGFFCILLRLFKKAKVKKLSGYYFLKNFLKLEINKKIKFLNIDPNEEESKLNFNYLSKDMGITNVISYIAPIYKNNLVDKKLIDLILKEKPKYIIVNIGGEVQEILAMKIIKKINYKVSIICTGAAIAFLTKKQAPINDLIDKYYLGWFVRLIHNPTKYFSRIVSSLNLIKLFIYENNFKKIK